MQLTKVQLAKLTIEIDKLEKEARKLESRARVEDKSFYDSAITYGSELAGSSGTEHMYKKAGLLREKAEFLKSVKVGYVLLTYREHVKARLGKIRQKIDSLTTEKSSLEIRLQHFEWLQKILSS